MINVNEMISSIHKKFDISYTKDIFKQNCKMNSVKPCQRCIFSSECSILGFAKVVKNTCVLHNIYVYI